MKKILSMFFILFFLFSCNGNKEENKVTPNETKTGATAQNEDENKIISMNMDHHFVKCINTTINLNIKSRYEDEKKAIPSKDLKAPKLRDLSASITIKDMYDLTSGDYFIDLDCQNYNISSIEGLQYINNSNSSDLGLNFDNNNITDITPFVDSFKKDSAYHGSIRFNNNNISDLSPLLKLKDIKFEKNWWFSSLDLKHNNLSESDLSPLQYLKGTINLDNNNIEKINIGENNVNDIKFKALVISLQNNKLKDLSNIKVFEGLEIIRLGNNNISDIKALKDFNFSKLHILNLQNNKIKDISPLKDIDFSNIRDLDLSNNEIKDLTPIKDIQFNGYHLNLEKNKIEDFTPLNTIKFSKKYMDENPNTYPIEGDIIVTLNGNPSNDYSKITSKIVKDSIDLEKKLIEFWKKKDEKRKKIKEKEFKEKDNK